MTYSNSYPSEPIRMYDREGKLIGLKYNKNNLYYKDNNGMWRAPDKYEYRPKDNNDWPYSPPIKPWKNPYPYKEVDENGDIYDVNEDYNDYGFDDIEDAIEERDNDEETVDDTTELLELQRKIEQLKAAKDALEKALPSKQVQPEPTPAKEETETRKIDLS